EFSEVLTTGYGPDLDEEKQEQFWQVMTAAMTQIMPSETKEGCLPLLGALAAIPRPEATRALARVAVFDPNVTIRARAIEALAVRRESDSTDVLVEGLRYPWPGVARNAAEAIVKLKRKDLVSRLEGLLDEPDPRAPRSEKINGRQATVARELVRI